jgi:hypothetical protein
MALLMENGGYESARFGPLARAVAAQVRDGTHLAAFEGGRIVAYAGYLPVQSASASKWLEDAGDLEIAASSAADTFAVSVVCATRPGLARRLLLAIRRGRPKARVVFRRDYADGRRSRKAALVLDVRGRAR